ncbi:MAG: hypothetical protein ACE5Q3_16050 [Alphaproteobacteria bacterium]
MKAFATWLLGTLAAFAILSGSYHTSLSDNPRKVLVIVDSSFPMEPVWHRVRERLKELDDQRYSEFALFTEKSRIHGWESRLSPGRFTPYGPRRFDRLLGGPTSAEFSEANTVYLLTNAPAGEIEAFGDWEIIRP